MNGAGRDIRAVLFDKDGTLIDFQKSWEAVNREAALLAARGDPAFARDLLELGGTDPLTGITRAGSLMGAGNTREIAQAWVDAGSAFEHGELVAVLDGLFTRAAADAVPVTDLAAFFSSLAREGIATGIASSDSEAAIRTLLRSRNVEEHVAFVAGYDSGHGTKPGPGMLLAFARSVGVAPRHIAVVGDNLHDMEMARSGGAGLRVGVLTGNSDRATLETACDLCLPSIADLLARVRSRVPVRTN